MQQGAPALRVAGVSVVPGGSEDAPSVTLVVRRRQPSGVLGQPRGGRFRAAPSGPLGRVIELVGDVGVGALDREREVHRVLLLADRARCEQGVQLAAALRADVGVDAGGEQRMGEGQPPPADLEHAGGDRLVDRAAKALVARDLGDHRRAAVKQGRDELQQPAGVVGQLPQPLADELLEARGHGQRVIGTERATPAGQPAAELEAVERIAARARVDPQQNRSGERRIQPLLEQAVKRADPQRTHGDALDPRRVERAIEVQRRLVVAGAAAREQQSRRLVAQSPHDELEHRPRRLVEPLDVVDGHEHGGGCAELVQHSQDCAADRAFVGGLPVSLLEQQRHFERVALGGGQRRQRVVEYPVEQVGDARERQLRFGQCRRAAQHALSFIDGQRDAVAPQRRLADARIAFDHERAHRRVARQELAQDRLFSIAPHHVV